MSACPKAVCYRDDFMATLGLLPHFVSYPVCMLPAAALSGKPSLRRQLVHTATTTEKPHMTKQKEIESIPKG